MKIQRPQLFPERDPTVKNVPFIRVLPLVGYLLVISESLEYRFLFSLGWLKQGRGNFLGFVV
jgi:hypothetical protein